MAFDPVLYPLSTGDHFVSSVEYLTDITPIGNQREYRIARGDDGLVSFDALQGLRSLADLHAILSFFRRRKGRARSFAVIDHLDYTQDWAGGFAPIGLGTGNVATEFQLTKTYQANDDAEAEVRTIRKASYGTVKIYVDSVLKTEGVDWALTNGYQGKNHDTAANYLCTVDGKFKFLSGHVPASDAVIEAKFEFFVPVRFVDDKLPVDDIVSFMKPDPNNTSRWILGDDATGDLPKVSLIEDKSA